MPKVTAPGKLIYVDDGILSLLVIAIEGDSVRVRALNNGTLSSRKGVNLPKTDVDLPALSEKDKAEVAQWVEKVAKGEVGKEADLKVRILVDRTGA